MMRILMANLPYAGHVTPTLGLIDEFIKRGHEVGYVLSGEWREEIEKRGAKFIEYQGYKGNPMVLNNCYYALYNTIKSVADEYDCIIYEMFFILGKRLADKLNKPSIRVFSTFALNKTVINELISKKGSMLTIFKNKLIRKFETKYQVRKLDLEVKDFFEEISNTKQDVNIVYTSKAFQVHNEDFSNKNFFFVGSPTKYICEEKIVSQHPIIYISLGTIFNNNIKFYKKCINAFRNENVTIYMSIGKSIDKKVFKNVSENIHIFNYAPQVEILNNASLFLTHGGMNSVNEAIKFGVPMVVFPMAADQPYVGARVQELEIGKCCSLKSLTVDKIREVSYEVMSDQTINENIKFLKKDMLEYAGNEKAVEIILEYLELESKF